MSHVDAVVVGSGPNGLAAAITIARAGRKVAVFEAAETIGGGCRTEALTLPGFQHDVCSAVHPLAAVSPFFTSLPLQQFGLEWLTPPVMVAHPFDDRPSARVYQSLDATCAALARDGAAYRRLLEGPLADWTAIRSVALGTAAWPSHPLGLLQFGFRALRPAAHLARAHFVEPETRALLAGIGAHSLRPLDRPGTSAVALALLLAAHVRGWCLPRGGARAIAGALAGYLRSLGGEIVTGAPIASIDELPAAKAILCDLTPQPLLRVAGHRFPAAFRRALERYRYGVGVFKVDWALDGPIPWRDAACASAGTVHLGGDFDEVCASQREPWRANASTPPFVLLAQPTCVDASRAPAGAHIAWGYCHVPLGSATDMLPAIEAQIERFAPGFVDRVLARAVSRPADFERRNANLVGGDITGGALSLGQLAARPTWRWHGTPATGIYICSSSTPPGPGVHGMCGYLAARRALRETLRA